MPLACPEFKKGLTRAMKRYTAFNLEIDSDVPLEGAIVRTSTDTPAGDVRISYSPCCTDHEAPNRLESGPYSLDGDGHVHFTLPGVACFSAARGGSTLQIRNLQPTPDDLKQGRPSMEDILIATALPMLLWMRGNLVLHGAAAILPGQQKAVGFLGPSGAGKTTLLHALLQQGATIVAEDAISLYLEESGKVCASGLPGILHLRAHGHALTLPRESLGVPAAQQAKSATLGALLVLAESADEQALPSCTRYSRIEAFQTLLQQRHRPRVPALLGMDQDHLQVWASLAHSVPVWKWRPPGRQLPSLYEVREILAERC